MNNVLTKVTEVLVGILFGVGLLISGMTNPKKIIGFLDVAGRWDPSLAFVMLGAISVTATSFFLWGKRPLSLLQSQMRIPTQTQIDPRLMVGALIFGIGWGLAGYCPGPAIVSIAAGNPQALIFVAAMIAGMVVFEGFILAVKPRPSS
jgi:hypothetical protein